MIKEWRQQNFFGGFSDDKFTGIQNSYRYAKAVEIRKNPSSLTLAYKPEAETIALTAEVNSMITIVSTGDIIAFSADGKIFRNAAGVGTWVLVYTDSASRNILNGIEYNDYVYWFTNAKIHRIAISNIDSDWSGSVTEDYKTFANGNSNAHPALEQNNKLYIGDSYCLAELDDLGTFTNNKLEIFHDEEIRALTFGGAVMRIFSRKSSLAHGGHKYHWNSVSESYNEKVYFSETIHAVVSNGGEDYVIAGTIPYLYLSSGYSWQKIKRFPLVADTEDAFIAPNGMTKYNDLIAIGAIQSGSGSLGRGVYTYGKEDIKYPDALNFDYPTSNDNITDTIYSVHNSNGTLYFSWKNGSSYGIDKVNTSKYATTGSLHSRVLIGDRASQEKTAIAIQAAFNKLTADQEINIYLRKNLADSWESIPELAIKYSDTIDRTLSFKREDDALDIGDFTFLESKIVLTSGTNQTTTPELKELIIEFDDGLEKGD